MEIVYVYGTPKAISEALKKQNEIETKIKKIHPGLEIKFCAEPMVYMNMFDLNWTKERCDEILYLFQSPTPEGEKEQGE